MGDIRVRSGAAVAALIALVAVALIGCSNLPTSPQSAHAVSTSEALARMVRMPGGAAPGGLVGDPQGGTASATTSPPEQTIKTISGVDGGRVSAGRFTVDVPPGAIEGEGEISVKVPDTTSLRVDLHILNAPNAFKVPVTLEVSYAGHDNPDADPGHYKIFWFDEAAGVWRMLPTEVDLARQKVSTRLEHFSTYGVLEAKAGW